MKSKPMLFAVWSACVLIIVVATAFILGDKYGVEHMSPKNITPHQIAEAMREDHFYSSYNENTLVITGTVMSASSHEISLQTNSPYSVTCEFTRLAPHTVKGQTITLVSEGATADREASGVKLKGCIKV